MKPSFAQCTVIAVLFPVFCFIAALLFFFGMWFIAYNLGDIIVLVVLFALCRLTAGLLCKAVQKHRAA